MVSLGKILLLFGLALAGVGALLMFSDRIPLIGRLPGDFTFRRGNVQVYIPVMTSIILSVVLSLVMWLVSYFGRK